MCKIDVIQRVFGSTANTACCMLLFAAL